MLEINKYLFRFLSDSLIEAYFSMLYSVLIIGTRIFIGEINENPKCYGNKCQKGEHFADKAENEPGNNESNVNKDLLDLEIGSHNLDKIFKSDFVSVLSFFMSFQLL